MSKFREDIAWAAGLFDGEGTIGRYPYTRNGKQYWRATMSMHLCDGDLLARFVEIVGVGTVNGPYNYSTEKTKRQPAYYWNIGSFERVQAVVAMLWPWLGFRRKDKAREVLLAERTTNPRARHSRNEKGQFV